MKTFIFLALASTIAVTAALPGAAVPDEGPKPVDPVVEYPAAAHDDQETKVEQGVKMCKHFSPTAGHTWGPCESPSTEPQDYRIGIGPQWCGNQPCKPEDRLRNRHKAHQSPRAQAKRGSRWPVGDAAKPYKIMCLQRIRSGQKLSEICPHCCDPYYYETRSFLSSRWCHEHCRTYHPPPFLPWLPNGPARVKRDGLLEQKESTVEGEVAEVEVETHKLGEESPALDAHGEASNEEGEDSDSDSDEIFTNFEIPLPDDMMGFYVDPRNA
ncbi:hypothetical protein K491DRAFT_213794 [Lophiostoma macrostomum CBS 122681]|uniref:C2H2-type domain-containing protein n=1 Tax=Lophiostoma macrostomum CBS 122681 TaxID=1314788 RepID=A0A6A6SRI2_9PLEO|nr:hypothetical protein K491DRAFT_213794 [Lophiostoma macrostomum CBS 122681]